MNLINALPIFLIYTTFVIADHITNIDNEKMILTCEDGPCNRPNLNNFECSNRIMNDNYKFICLSEKMSFWNNYDFSYELSQMNFNNFFVWYVTFVVVFLCAIIHLKCLLILINYIIKM